MKKKYVHGYSERETQRLQEQSGILEELLHWDTAYPAASKVLEAGCGVGGQTMLLARRNPEAEFTSIDISQDSLDAAKELIDKEGMSNVSFQQADIMTEGTPCYFHRCFRWFAIGVGRHHVNNILDIRHNVAALRNNDDGNGRFYDAAILRDLLFMFCAIN